MNFNKLNFLLQLTFFLAVVSCSSSKAKITTDSGIMYAMIYDYNNTAVSGVLVSVNGRELVRSDMHGRFILDFSTHGEYTIELSKSGYEKLIQNFDYNPMKVLYFKMITADQLVTLAEECINKFDFEEAEKNIVRAYKLEPHRIDIIYLKTVALYLAGKYEEAKTASAELSSKGYNGKYAELLKKTVAASCDAAADN